MAWMPFAQACAKGGALGCICWMCLHHASGRVHDADVVGGAANGHLLHIGVGVGDSLGGGKSREAGPMPVVSAVVNEQVSLAFANA